MGAFDSGPMDKMGRRVRFSSICVVEGGGTYVAGGGLWPVIAVSGISGGGGNRTGSACTRGISVS